MKIFARPNKAFFDYEERLSRKPVSWPPTCHPVPTLWDRAKTLFQQTLATITSLARLAWRQSLSRTERHELLIRLVPAEKIVRMLLVVEAITFLLMTPEGARIRRNAKPIALPEPPPPPGQPKRMTERDRFRMLAMQSVAAHHPVIDPRVTEREERQRREALEAMRDENPFGDPLQRSQFRIMHWRHAEPPLIEITPQRRVWAGLLEASGDCIEVAPAARTRIAPEDDDTPTGPGLSIARRIAALERVLANPWPTIRRLAARLASLPRDAFDAPAPDRFRAAEWWHGRPEYYNACTLAALAHRALMRTEAKLEPG